MTCMKRIALNKLTAHPDNANRMPEDRLAKLTAHIERTGQYPPLIVREHPAEDGCYEILDGHHRLRALERLGYEQANCDVWNVCDDEATVLLLTLNRLQGDDDPQRRGALLAQLRERLDVPAMAKLVPEDAPGITKLIELTRPPKELAAPVDADAMPQAVTFFIDAAQRDALLAKLRAVDRDRSRALVRLLELDE